jgi:hypothetical protein
MALGLFFAGSAAADGTVATSREFCFRSGPGSKCEWFPITEFGFALAAHPKEGAAFGRIWNVGLLNNVDDRTALGAMVIVTHDNGATVTLAPVGRFWLSHSFAVDLAPGVVVYGHQLRDFAPERPSPDVLILRRTTGRAPGFALDASISYRDWGALFVHTSVLPYSEVTRSTFTRIDLPGGGSSWIGGPPETLEQRGVLTEHWIGVRAGSYPGLGLGILAALATVAATVGIED